MAMNAEGNSIDSASDSEGDAVKSDPSKIDLAGFLSLVLEQLPPAGDGEEVLQSFRIFDRELNGYISVEDFRTVRLDEAADASTAATFPSLSGADATSHSDPAPGHVGQRGRVADGH